MHYNDCDCPTEVPQEIVQRCSPTGLDEALEAAPNADCNGLIPDGSIEDGVLQLERLKRGYRYPFCADPKNS